MSKISVIIPTYNSEKYLKECLNSVINQTLKDIEIIIVDADSQDSTLEIIEQYKDNRIKLINRSYEYAGISRNIGLDCASSKYCMFLDSDDTLELNACEITYNKIKNNDVDFVMFGNYEFSDTGKKNQNLMIKNIVEEKGTGEFCYKDLTNFLGIDSVEPWKKAYKLEFLRLNNIRFGNESFGEDVVFYWKVLTTFNKCIVCDNYLYNYRKTSKNTGTGTILTRYNVNFEVLNKARLILEKSNRCDEYIEFFLISLIKNYTYWLNKIDESERSNYYKQMQLEFERINKKYDVSFLLGNNSKVLKFFLSSLKNKYIQLPKKENKIFYFAKFANILKINFFWIRIQLRNKR